MERRALFSWMLLFFIPVLVSGCGTASDDTDAGWEDGHDADALNQDGDETGADPGADQGADPGSDPGGDLGDPGGDLGGDLGDPGSDLGDPGGDLGDPGGDTGGDPGGDEGPLIGLAYPERDVYHIKAIQPDFWPDKNEFVNHVTGGVAVNLVWDLWEPAYNPPPCDQGTQEEYDGHCFTIRQGEDGAVRDYSALGLVVTGIIYGVPAWARTGNSGCSPISPAFERFCIGDDSADYGRFVGMLARRYNGLHGNGRVADFVIHNEVNSNIWFDIGCGQGVACDQATWIQKYVDDFAAAYDQIKSHQSEAKVLLSFEHHFDTEYDRPADDNAMLSVKTFVTTFAAAIGDREWKIAYHPYAPNLLRPEFSPLDLPKVTYGNIGVLLGWLRQTFPDKPHAWEVELTESGVNSSVPNSTEAAQATAVCDGFINVLGTPGITNYIYHRMRDNSDEGELQLGLVRSDDSYKPAWAVWALCNHIHDDPPQLSCGFEDLPYVRLRRSVRDHGVTVRHWASTRLAPADFSEEASWRLLREPAPGTSLLFECLVEAIWPGPHNFLSFDVGCEGYVNLGPVGYIYAESGPDTVALYRCANQAGLDHFVSTDPDCEGLVTEHLLGYGLQ